MSLAMQTITLPKEIKKITVGLGWDVAEESKSLEEFFLNGGSIDLDLSCLLIDSRKKIADRVSYRQLASNNWAVVHSGDNETGLGKGDDEKITIDLASVPDDIQALILTVNAFSGQAFEYIHNAFCRLVDTRNNEEIAHYPFASQGSHTAVIVARIYRKDENSWFVSYIGETSHGRSVESLLPQIMNHL